MIPAYGESPYLKETLASATRNLPLNVPITVLEDPSDSTSVRETVANFLDRVEYKLNSERLGIAGNFNKAIEISTGEYTVILGSDDLININPIEEIELIHSHRKNNTAAIIFDALVIDSKSKTAVSITDIIKKILKPQTRNTRKLKTKKFFRSLLLGDWVYFPSVAWETNALKVTKFDESFLSAMDLKIFFELILDNYNFYYCPTKFIAYRRHKDSFSSSFARNAGRFEEEFKCNNFALKIIKEKEWNSLKILVKTSPIIRIHIILTIVKKIFNQDTKNINNLLRLLIKRI